MKSNEQSRKDRRRKLLWLLPLLALPFATLFFWAMGGGGAAQSEGTTAKGFNLKLPSAKVNNDEGLDKLNYYDQAALDSSKVAELRKKDPNYRHDSLEIASDSAALQRKYGGLAVSRFQSPQEKQVYERLEALQRAVSSPLPAKASIAESAPVIQQPDAHFAPQAAKLEEMMQSMGAPSECDPELEQIGGMLESILDIQYPERMEQKLKAASSAERGRVYPVATTKETNVITTLDGQQLSVSSTFSNGSTHNGFFSLEQSNEQSKENAVQAVVAETQVVVNGSTVKMQLGQDIYINGKKIPKNTYVYGTASLKGERLTIAITNIRHGNSLFPVELKVYDLDGLDGIYIPGAINREVAKSSADRSVQTLGVTTLSDSWGAQAAGAGIEAAKGLFSKKVKLVKVTLKAGYNILLKDEKQKE
ncbi:conjugative transposon protein TraM [Flavobacterium sp. MK4S-17]|uniref:conjugative transposon protein TraM n=1 Tax=Flavobacterium sp. MK4S-17 TaxID=2543737 RepID=UPI00135744C2|nr:conjugative transposon protein TraM [Flavobacterium sp. MK4S-17]